MTLHESILEQDDEDSQGRKRCKVESVTLDEAQLSPVTSNDTRASMAVAATVMGAK